jgi:quinol monooxygenase YgiN
MATMIVKHRVGNFETWKQIFDEMDPARRQHGWVGYDVLRDAADPNLVTIVNRVKDLAGAKAYGGSPELRAAMGRAGIQGAPDITFLEDAESRRY